jgi:hypothetical protein
MYVALYERYILKIYVNYEIINNNGSTNNRLVIVLNSKFCINRSNISNWSIYPFDLGVLTLLIIKCNIEQQAT